ncbi:MAG: DNA polymerase III subunit gamma/tau [Patescibacteria group bacterium]
MTETIYRKYRPQTFAAVAGQEHIKQTLENELKLNKLAHAYLFCGTRGVGKTTLARLLAKAINCENRQDGDFEPCNKCLSCVEITAGRSLDLIELDAASNRRIDDIREIRDKVPYGTARSRYKVVIIDEAHMLTTEAFNALLKTLEEPPAHVFFILATTEAHKLPATIVSRCQRFDFQRLSVTLLKKRLAEIASQEKVEIADSVLTDMAYLANGSSRDAESYLGKLLGLGIKKITAEAAQIVLPHSNIKIALEFVTDIVNKKAGPAIELINKFLSAGGEINYFYKQVLELLRHLLLVKLGGKTATGANVEYEDEIADELMNLVPPLSYLRLQNLLSDWLEIEGQWRQAEVYQLPLEIAVIKMCELTKNEAEIQVPFKPPLIPAAPPPPATGIKIAATEADSKISGKMSVQEIIDKWDTVVNKIKEYNHSLSFILSVAKPIKLEKNKLYVQFQYKLHQERVKEKKIKLTIENVVNEILGAQLIIEPVVPEASSNASGTTGDLLSSVVNTLGGRVVEEV